MNKVKIKIADKTFKVELANTEEEKEKGLQGIKSLPKDEGMLFIFEDTEEVSMWMKDTLIPLDIVFIDPELSVIKIYQGTPESEEIFTEENVGFVLEVNQGSGIAIGDELDFAPNSRVKKDKMVVIGANGKPQMELEGGERIFSRGNTKTLIKFAKKADMSQRDSDFKALGKRVFKFIEAQDNNEPEFVELKK